jgi:chemotaxis protein histidine kinase CheA/ActR/RegA family two-component response regulator
MTLDPDVLAVFLPEARAHLTALADGDVDARRRAAHALVGTCAMVGLDELSERARAISVALKTSGDATAERQRFAEALGALEADKGDARSSAWKPDELRALRSFFLDEALESLAAIQEGLQQVRLRPWESAPVTGLLRKLHTLKGAAGSVELSELAAAAHALEDQLIVARERLPIASTAELEAGARELECLIRQVEREVRPPPQPRSERRAADPAPAAPQPMEHTVRVEVEGLDALMDAASELVFDRTRIVRRLQELDGCLRDLKRVGAALQLAYPGEIATELFDAVVSLGRAVAGVGDDAEGLARTSATLQEGLRRVRMMAVGKLFARFGQPMRELARRQGKQVEFVSSGEETEIDKAVVERVAEPLLHLCRNAIAHGIEPPEVRRALGKPAAGTLTVSARHDDDAVEIAVSDDGQGIDLAGVRMALTASGRVTEEESRALTEAQLYESLFAPGISTRGSADDVAGRGVGLDTVRETIARLNGTVRVSSTPGQGARFVVRLPLTTAVEQALLFKVGGQVYAVPAARVQEAAEIDPNDLRPNERVTVRGRELPVVRLGALFGVPPPPGHSRRAALVMTSGELEFAITCDRVIGPREIVVRSLGPLLADLPLYAGATISGAGKVQLILDVTRLAQLALTGVRGSRPTRAQGPRRVLIADDSRSIREALSLILQQGGFAVEAVPDGWDAWDLLQDRPFDALVTDLEMPRLDGLELIARVRGTPALEALPIVAVSSRTADATRARVLAAGADAFVPKPLRKRPVVDALESALSARARAPAPPE